MLDPHSEKLLWFLFGGSKGGFNRIRIIDLIRERPHNTNQIAEFLKMDYKSVQHHLTVLEKNNLINKIGERYGVLYFISNYLESNIDSYTKIKQKVNPNSKN
jgi:DNA-binding transcriptional ArsR family regulator